MKLNWIIASLVYLSCSPALIDQHHHFNEQDREYIVAKLNNDMQCLSYYLNNCKDEKIFIEFHLNKNGKTKNVSVLNKTLSNSIFSKEIKLFYSDTCHDFIEVLIDKSRIFKYLFTCKSKANSPCYKPCGGGYLGNDVIEY